MDTKRAWAYFRCSTDQQEQSIPDQKKAMQPILREHNIEIVEAFEDEGVSGVDPVEKRPDFSRMLSMGRAGMHKQQGVSCVLCYDISRWGRFRDPLDSIAYAQDFKRTGLPIYFTNDKYVQFAADTRQAANAILAVLGSMEATGYSQERSKLVTRGMKSAAEQGYWTGGRTPYGMVRVVLDAEGKPERVLEDGERNAIKGRKVVLAPGPVEKVRVVQTVFGLRLRGQGYGMIANHLNRRSIPSPENTLWKDSAVLRILRNPVYVGQATNWRTNRHFSFVMTKR